MSGKGVPSLPKFLRASRAKIFFKGYLPWFFENFHIFFKGYYLGFLKISARFACENFFHKGIYYLGFLKIFARFARKNFFQRVLPWFFENFRALRAWKFFSQGYLLPWFFENFRALRAQKFFSKGTYYLGFLKISARFARGNFFPKGITLVFWKFSRASRAEIFYQGHLLPCFFENFLALRALKFFSKADIQPFNFFKKKKKEEGRKKGSFF